MLTVGKLQRLTRCQGTVLVKMPEKPWMSTAGHESRVTVDKSNLVSERTGTQVALAAQLGDLLDCWASTNRNSSSEYIRQGPSLLCRRLADMLAYYYYFPEF